MRRKLQLVGISVALALLAGSPAAAKDWAKAFDKGEILVYQDKVAGSSDPAIVLKGVIEAPPEKVWALVSNCNHYKRNLLRIKDAKMLPKKNGKVVCKITVDMPWPYSDITSITEAVHVAGPPKWSRSWSLSSGAYKYNSGSWTLTRWRGDAKRTLVVYRVHAKPKAWVPGWIRRKAQKSTLPKLLEHLRKRASTS
jgi:ribosome-associated toxin RatA of RatAB toxin-antitoxin module